METLRPKPTALGGEPRPPITKFSELHAQRSAAIERAGAGTLGNNPNFVLLLLGFDVVALGLLGLWWATWPALKALIPF